MRRLRGIAPLAALAAVLSFGGIVASSGPASAQAGQTKQPIEVTVFSSGQKLVSSTGQSLYLGIEAELDTFHGQPPGESFFFYVSDPAEEHDWNWFDDGTGDLSYDATTGVGAIQSPTQTGSWGSATLTIKPRSTATAPTQSCGGDEQTWAVILQGSVWFNTHSTVWGAFGSEQAPLTFKVKATAEADFSRKALDGSCTQPTKRHCNGQISWDQPGGRDGLLSGQSDRHDGTIDDQFFYFGSRSVGHGNGPDRDDFAFLNAHRPPKVLTTKHGKTVLRIRASARGVITGSATLTGIGHPVVHKHECLGGTTTDWNASYTPGPHPLTVHLAIGGTLTEPAEKSGADFSVETR
jgi:hypothetical protein